MKRRCFRDNGRRFVPQANSEAKPVKIAAPALRQRLSSEAIDPMPMTPEQLRVCLQTDLARWTALAREQKDLARRLSF